MRWATLVVLLPLAAIAAGIAAAGTRRSGGPVGDDPTAAAATYRPVQVREEGYVSSDTCRACHPSQYATWHASYHRTMTQLASPDAIRANFAGVTVTGVQERAMQLERHGDEFWAEFDDPDWKGTRESTPRIRRQIVMLTGSHQQQVYWYRTSHNRLLGQLPGMYLIDEQRWIPRRAGFLRPPPESGYSETGRWNATCIDCHATNGKRELNAILGSQPLETLVANTTVGEFGIACEACHGPAAEHVRANRNPLRRYRLHVTSAPDATSLQPGRRASGVGDAGLDARRSSQVCGQCHSTSIRYDRLGVPSPGGAPTLFRPGRDLDASHFVLQPSRNGDAPLMRQILEADPAALRDSFWSDGMVRVSGREYNGLIDSPCFTNARDEQRRLSCFSCHTMHKPTADGRTTREWADTHQVTTGMESNEACLQCHDGYRANPSAHTKHRPDSSGSSCYNCHMPYTSYGLLRALRSHRISSPRVQASLETGRPNACNQCHLDRTLAWTGEHLQAWYGTAAPTLSDDEQRLPASMLWLLRGDAGQRALMAWTLGWKPAQQVSGTSWMAPSLSVLMNDPYEAIRYIAHRSLRTLPGFATFTYDFTAPSAQRTAGVMQVMTDWRRSGALALAPEAPALLLDASGTMKPEVTRLLRQRDPRRIDLRE